MAPLSFWNMKFHAMTPAYIGRAYGMRKSVRTTALPRKGRWRTTAASIPRPQEIPTTSTVKAQVTRRELRNPWPVELDMSRTLRKLSRPAFGAAAQLLMKNLVSFLKLIQMPVSIGTTWMKSSKMTAGRIMR